MQIEILFKFGCSSRKIMSLWSAEKALFSSVILFILIDSNNEPTGI
jgi:hypothetical protein